MNLLDLGVKRQKGFFKRFVERVDRTVTLRDPDPLLFTSDNQRNRGFLDGFFILIPDMFGRNHHIFKLKKLLSLARDFTQQKLKTGFG